MTTRLAIPLLLVLGCGPLVMIPGGSLSGDVQPAPADWSFTDEVETVQLETRPSDPYSVNVWGVGVGDIFYIASGRGVDAAWAEHIEANPNVRLRVGDAIYELDATRTSDPAELDAFLVAAKAKYDFEPEPGQRETAVLYRLTPR
jgi:hypothetical protein